MKKILLAIFAVCIASHGYAQTAFTGTYTWGAIGNTNSFAYNGTDIANLTESAFTKIGITTSSSSGNFRATGFALDPVLGSLTGTNDPTKYFDFSLTAASGFTLSMTNINFGVGRSGTGPRTFVWGSSVDSFATIITNYTVPTGVTNNAGVLTIADTTTTFTNIVLDLSGASFQSLTNITFRFYAYNAESGAGTGGFQGPLSFSGSLLNTNPVTGGTYWAADPAGGGSGTWTSGGTTWATNTGGAGAGQTQSSATLNFADTAGTVTVSGGVAVSNGMTFQTTDYSVQDSTVTLAATAIANNAITTETGVTTTISSVLAGTTGMTKSGNGTLVLSGANTFSGNATISGGTLEITNDSALGDAANDLANNGTLKTTTSVSLGAGRDLSGNGTYDIANGTTLTVNGNANNTATTLANTGTLDLQGAIRTLGAVTINAPMTLNAVGAISATGLTAPGVSSGTATINPDIIFTTSGDKTLNVAAGGIVDLNGTLTNSASATSRIAKTGSGTLILSAANNMGGLRVGASGASPTEGGTVVLENSAIGTQAQAIQHNYGTLRAASSLVFINGLSIGGRTNGAALLAGSNMEFQGQSAFFRGTGTTGELVLNVDNTTTFSGGFAVTSGGGTATGVTFGGNGHVIISGNSSLLTDTITLTDTVKLTLTNTIGGGLNVGGASLLAGGGGTVSGNVSFSTGGKLELNLLNPTLTVSGSTVSFVNWTINNIAGLDSSTPNGTYILIGGTATVSTNGLANIGAENAFDLGGGQSAYFSIGSLELNVVPEPSTYALLALSGLALAGYAARRRRRRQISLSKFATLV
jgi:autotransporter-associated beta strand protein